MGLAAATGSPATATTTLTPSDDATIRESRPSQNYGSNAALEVDLSSKKDVLLRFNVTGVGGQAVARATLRLYVLDPSSFGGRFDLMSNAGWSESTVTWGNAPPADGGVVATLGAVSSGTWVELDVTAAVTGDGPVAFRVSSTSSNGADYASSEHTSGNAPELVVEVEQGAPGPDTQPPSAPGTLSATAVDSGRVDLGWGAASDDVAVAGYRIERCQGSGCSSFVEIAAPAGTGTSFSDSSVVAGTSYSYRVRAADVVPNLGPYSNTATATPPTPPPAAVVTFAPTDDATIRESRPSQNYGSNAALEVDLSSKKDVLLRFNVTGVGGQAVARATLRLYVLDPSDFGGRFDLMSNAGWSESTVTWGNAPPADGGVVGTLGAVSSGTWVELDVTAAVTGDGPVAFRVSSTSSNGADYASSEHTSGNAPELVLDSSPGPPPPPGPPAPIRAAFYYPWFPETWTVGGSHVAYHPTLGYYQSTDPVVQDSHIRTLDEAGMDAAISSWWGPGHYTDARLGQLLDRTTSLGSPLKWAIYHEVEGAQDPSAGTLANELAYIRDNLAQSPAYLRVDGRFVVFVYNANDFDCSVADRWRQANQAVGNAAYVVLKVFSGFESCAGQPDSWHQYSPAAAASHQNGYSYSISPGFWGADDSAPGLGRDLARWQQNVLDMVASGEPWQLVTTFNEWGEGTAIESASEWGSDYLDALKAAATFTFAAAGDVGGSESRAGVVLPDIGANAEAFFVLGDMAYSEIVPEAAWCAWAYSRLGNTSYPLELVVGNHEEDAGPDGFIRNFTAGCPDRLGAVGDYGTEYYVDRGPVRMIMIGAATTVDGVLYDYRPGTAHWSWLTARVDEAKSQGRWVVVGMHKVCITMGTKACEVGEALADYLAANADLVLSGHDHTYQRSHQLSCVDANTTTGACIVDTDGVHQAGQGAVWVIVGAVGRSLYSCSHADSEAGYFAAHWCAEEDSGTHGYLLVTASGSQLRAEFRSQTGTAFSDSFSITR